MFQSLIIALSMYSKIPVPRVEWNEKNMKYALCFFPVVGVVIGVALWIVLQFCDMLGLGIFFKACIAVIIPVIITGGIHMDGYLDTVDALCSYADREKKLEILKDPNSGAFAIIYGIVYFVADIAIWTEIKVSVLPFICASFVVSRTLSGLSVALFPLAKNTGLASAFQNGSHRKNVKLIMAALFVAESALCIWMNPLYGGVVVMISLLSFGIHYMVCMKKFGGITGDLAGFFLQICELMVLAGLMAAGCAKGIK